MPENEIENTTTGAGADVRTEADLDALADGATTATNSERPMSAPAEKVAAEKTAEELFEFTHNGKKIKASREKLLEYAQRGYDYPQRAQKFNQEKAQWDQQKAQWEKQWGIYKQVDDYAKQNKDWWNLVQNSFKTRHPPQQPMMNGQAAGGSAPHLADPGNDPYAPKFQLLEEKLNQFEQIAQAFQEKERIAQEQAEDSKLDKDVQSFRGQHADLDWESLDENGKTLEVRIMEHAQANGIPSFRAAARDLLHEDLVAKAASMGKISVAQGIQNRSRLGVLGTTPTPTKGFQSKTRDMRKTSYEDLERDIREELRQGRS